MLALVILSIALITAAFLFVKYGTAQKPVPAKVVSIKTSPTMQSEIIKLYDEIESIDDIPDRVKAFNKTILIEEDIKQLPKRYKDIEGLDEDLGELKIRLSVQRNKILSKGLQIRNQ